MKLELGFVIVGLLGFALAVVAALQVFGGCDCKGCGSCKPSVQCLCTDSGKTCCCQHGECGCSDCPMKS